MGVITVDTDQSKRYFYIGEALEDNGFEEVRDDYNGDYSYIKDGVAYKIVEFEHFNTTIYWVKIIEESDYKYYKSDKIKKELEEAVMEEELTLDDLDGICIDIIGEDRSIFDYNICEFISDDIGSFAWGNSDTEYNVEFMVLKRDEDDIWVKVIGIDTI